MHLDVLYEKIKVYIQLSFQCHFMTKVGILVSEIATHVNLHMLKAIQFVAYGKRKNKKRQKNI